MIHRSCARSSRRSCSALTRGRGALFAVVTLAVVAIGGCGEDDGGDTTTFSPEVDWQRTEARADCESFTPTRLPFFGELHPPLVGPRAILGHSPFPGEEDVVYIGGFDHNGHPFHNTAWIFKVHVDDLAAGLLTFPIAEP